MRLGLLTIVIITLATCEQKVTEFDAEWTGSLGRIVANGGDLGALEYLRLDGAGPEQGRMTLVSADDGSDRQAARLETRGQPRRMESLAAQLVTIDDIAVGDMCWLRFNARAVQPQVELGLGRLSILVGSSAADVEPMLAQTVYIEPAWTPIDFTFVAADDLDAGEGVVTFAVGTQLQVLDIASVSMRCFDSDSAVVSLPRTSFSYAGREPEALWRSLAESQIERYRKASLTIDVIDASGEPVSDAEIQVQMTRHAFKFGTLINVDELTGNKAEDDLAKTVSYRTDLGGLFNTVTLDEPLRWTAWTDPARRQTTEDALDWVRSLGLDLRGQGLVSTNRQDLPPTLLNVDAEPNAIRDAIRDGVVATAGELDGRVSTWNMVDRPRDTDGLLDLGGKEELATWFRLARSAAPNAELMLNESDILAGDRLAEVATLVGNLIADDAPIDGIAMQGEFKTQPPPLRVLSDRLDQLASFDLPLAITAFDMETPDDQLQRDFARDFLMLAFSHPSVESFIFGQFWEDDNQSAKAGLYTEDGAITEIGNLYRNLVMTRWWTDLIAASNTDGELKARVFQGDYTISVRKDDRSAGAMLSIGPEGAKVTLTLDAANIIEREEDPATLSAVDQ